MQSPIVLFALTESARRDFLPQWNPSALPPMAATWLDPNRTDANAWAQAFRDVQPEVVVSGWQTPLIPLTAGQLPARPLRYVCHLAGSVRTIVPRELIARGVLVTNWGNTISHTVAEHAVLLVLGALRNLPLWKPYLALDPSARPGAIPTMRTRALKGRRVGLHGFGNVARDIVARLKPFGVALSAYSEGVPEELFRGLGVTRCARLEDLFAASDVLIECEGLTPRTAGVVNAALLARLPDDAVFVNVGRGGVVDEGALAAQAAAGRIRVALDVYVNEPLPVDSPLHAVPNALLSPHIAGPTQDALTLCGDFAMQNLTRFLSGAPHKLEGIVTLAHYDRST